MQRNNCRLSAVEQWKKTKSAVCPFRFFGTLLLKDVIDFLDDRRAVFVVDSGLDGEYLVYVSSLHGEELKKFIEQAKEE